MKLGYRDLAFIPTCRQRSTRSNVHPTIPYDPVSTIFPLRIPVPGFPQIISQNSAAYRSIILLHYRSTGYLPISFHTHSILQQEKVPLRVKGLVIKVSITVEVLFEGEVGYASKWVGSEGVVKGGAEGIDGEVEREELDVSQ